MKFKAVIEVKYESDRLLQWQCEDIGLTEEQFKKTPHHKREELWQKPLFLSSWSGDKLKLIRFKVTKLK